jgi:glycosyltransferase involved in cell wall biosynthesis
LRARIVGRAWSAMARMAGRGGLGICRRALVCSEIERRNLLRIAPRADVRVVPNAVGERPRLPLPDDPTLLFVGTLFYPPNVEAMLWFLQQIWPQVRGALPDARLVVVGDGGERLRQSAAAWPGVDVRGFVGSLQECYAAARLVICPIRQGGGTRIKIIEAAAYGRPVVSTTIGAEGLAFADGREILIRDRPDEFAGACVTLLRDRQACERLGQAAREVARAQYGRAGAVALVSRMIGEIMAEDGRKPDLAGAESGQHPVAAQ